MEHISKVAFPGLGIGEFELGNVAFDVAGTCIHMGKTVNVICLEKDVAAGDPGFSVQKVQCRSCGSSFDALHRKTCPYCGQPYRLIHNDWMITSIRRR